MTVLVVLLTLVISAIIMVTGGNSGGTATAQNTAAPAPVASAPTIAQVAPVAEPAPQPDADVPSVDLGGCMIDAASFQLGSSGDSVTCIQAALSAVGFYDGPISGQFDADTDAATRALQGARGLYVDGVVGARTAESLGIWPGSETFVVRTPPPAAGAVDLWGFPLSSVASAGNGAPPMPPDSGQGTGKRVVYDRAGQRIWAVDDDEVVVRSYLVTGSQYANEKPGVHRVYSRSEMSTAWNGEADLPLMIRWLKTDRGAIGFHAIPLHKSDGSPYQTDAELGQKLSGGCQRQANEDAAFMWEFAQIGTTVVVT
jgi:peptidoglycan hydrolase-like protein with peptidoglycan-binding domain